MLGNVDTMCRPQVCGFVNHKEDIKCWKQGKAKEPGAEGLHSMTSELGIEAFRVNS